MKNRVKSITIQIVTAVLIITAILIHANISFNTRNNSELTNVVSEINQ